ncbi:hypothetical protein PUN28_016101 [Cardiocondyla obscurior]|uniref:Uncharacterized protein n=1 Tax=Cardiocondyla obscurior TaxID=286306 RepID=A0AAW2ETA7_9HYME
MEEGGQNDEKESDTESSYLRSSPYKGTRTPRGINGRWNLMEITEREREKEAQCWPGCISSYILRRLFTRQWFQPRPDKNYSNDRFLAWKKKRKKKFAKTKDKQIFNQE